MFTHQEWQHACRKMESGHVTRARGLLQPGHVWRNQRNILHVDLHTRHVCLNAAATLWIILQDCTHTHTHINGCYVKSQEASSWNTYSICSARPGPRDRRSEATGRINRPTRRYHLQTQTSRKNLQKDPAILSARLDRVWNMSRWKGILGAACGKC